MNSQQLQKLITDLQTGNERQRRAASYQLGKSKDPLAVPALIEAYTDPDISVHQNVLDGLKTIGTPEALEFLKTRQASPPPAPPAEPAPQAASPTLPLNQVPAPPPTGDWKCPKCGGKNPAKRTTCIGCNTPRPGTSPAPQAAPVTLTAKSSAPVSTGIVSQTPATLLENATWKIARLAAVEGKGRAAVHADSGLLAVHRSSGGLFTAKQDLRVYSTTESFSFTDFGFFESPRNLHFSASGKYILAPQMPTKGSTAFSSWDICGILADIGRKRRVTFRDKSTFASGIHGSQTGCFSPHETLVAIGNVHNSKINVVDIYSMSESILLSEGDSTTFLINWELSPQGNLSDTCCLEWAPDANSLAHITSQFGKAYALILWKFSKGDNIDSIQEDWEAILRLEKPQQRPYDDTKPDDSAVLLLQDFSGGVSFSPDSRYLAVGAGKAGAFSIVDTAGMSVVHEEPFTGSPLTSLAFLPGAKYLLAADANSMLHLWAMDFASSSPNLTQLDKFQFPARKPMQISASRDNPFALLVACDEKSTADLYRVDVLLP